MTKLSLPHWALSLTLLLSPVVLAQDDLQTQQWEFYGSLRVGLGWMDDGDRAALNLFDRATRVGLRGDYQLEETSWSPQLFWQIESQLAVDAGDGDLASRDSFLGLRDRWGSLRLGYFESPARRVGREAEQIHSRIGDNRNILRTDTLSGGQSGRSPGWDNRFGNALEYTSPQWAGLVATLLYSPHFSERFGQSSDTSPALSTRLSYTEGPLWLALAFETIDRDSDRVPGDEADPNLYRFAARYQLGQWGLSGLVQRAENQQGSARGNRDSIGAGVNYRLSSTTWLKGQIYRAGRLDDRAGTEATMLAGELEHRIYPTTRVYFSLAHTRNGELGQFQSARGLIGDGPPGQDSSSFSVLLRQDF